MVITMTESRKQIDDLTHRAIDELRSTVESKTAEFADGKEKIAKIEKDLDAYEAENQKLMAEIAGQKAAAEELEKKFKYLDSTYASMPEGVSTAQVDSEYKSAMNAFEQYSKHGLGHVEGGFAPNEIQEKYLRTDSNTQGGFLVYPEFVLEIIKDITEVSPVRQFARVRQAMSKSMEQPIRTALLNSGWVGECEEGPVDNSQYGNRRIHIKRNYVETEITVEDLMDSAFNMEEEIRSDVVERFAQVEGLAFVKGNGPNQPVGFMVAPDVPELNSGIANDIDFDNFYSLQANLKSGYLTNAIFAMNRFTIGRVRQLKASDGHYLWTAGNLAAGVPNAIAGQAYAEFPDMDDIAPDSFPIIFADFRSFYQIADRVSLEVLRDDITLKRQGKVVFSYFMRVGADVRQPEAGVKLKVSV